MSEDPIQTYLEVLRNLEVVTRQVEHVVGEVIKVAGALRDWKHVTVANGKTSFPAEALKNSINPDNWPTIQQLAESLSGWHQSRRAVENAWNAIPRDRRFGLQPPPSF